jgi:hypothetical protein
MEIDLKGKINDLFNQVSQGAKSRGYRAANVLRGASLEVLRGQRGGKIYRKPFTKKATYQASAPGEPPAVRSGTLRRSWQPRAQSEKEGGSVTVHPAIWTDVKYAPILQEGSPKMEPRPFEEPIIEKAKPEIEAIFGQPYLN